MFRVAPVVVVVVVVVAVLAAAEPPEDPAVVDEVEDGVDVMPAVGDCCCEDDVDGSGDVAAPAMTISRGCCFDAVEEEGN